MGQGAPRFLGARGHSNSAGCRGAGVQTGSQRGRRGGRTQHPRTPFCPRQWWGHHGQHLCAPPMPGGITGSVCVPPSVPRDITDSLHVPSVPTAPSLLPQGSHWVPVCPQYNPSTSPVCPQCAPSVPPACPQHGGVAPRQSGPRSSCVAPGPDPWCRTFLGQAWCWGGSTGERGWRGRGGGHGLRCSGA